MRTRLTELLGIEHPVMLAGMGGVSYAPLVAAVSAAGGFGCLGASTMGNEAMVAEMAAVRSATDKPFGVDLLTAMPGDLAEQVALVAEGGAAAFVAGLGVPGTVIDLCHRHGVLVVNMCGKVDHAVRAVEAGCDLVVAQGTEAGGHTGQVATMPLVPLVVDAVGGTSLAAHDAALRRIEQAGGQLISVPQLFCELQRDWARSETVPAFMNLFIETGGTAGIQFSYDRTE